MDSTDFTWSINECLKAGYLPGEDYAIKEDGPRVEVSFWYASSDLLESGRTIQGASVSQYMSSQEKAQEAATLLVEHYPVMFIAESTAHFNRLRSTDGERMKRLIHMIG